MPTPPNYGDLLPALPPFTLPTSRQFPGGPDTGTGHEALSVLKTGAPRPHFTYGALSLHDGYNYFVTKKTIPFPAYQQSVYPVARGLGAKKTGERQNSSTIAIEVCVVSQLQTRADLESLLDTLYAGLSLRQQKLILHNNDQRYWVADCVSASAGLIPGQVIAARVPIGFVAEQPFAYNPAPVSYTTGSVAIPNLTGTTWQQNYTVASPGNAFAYPTIAITNNSAVTITQVQLAQTNDNATITVSGLFLATNQTLYISSDPTTTTSFFVSIGALGSPIAFRGVPVVMEPPISPFQLTLTAATQPTVTVVWTWTPRWLS
jgi:hypothetical protein